MSNTPEQTDSLVVVVPVFNEEASVGAVIEEWVAVFTELSVDYQLLLLNDGSTDSTGMALDEWARRNARIRVIHKTNSGHGATCLHGYGIAVSGSNGWVFQIDSDGQCDPRYFAEVWSKRTTALAVVGTRTSRDDGWARRFISMCVRWTVLMATGTSVPDPNVPYRLMRADVLRAAISRFPDGFHLSNIFLALVLKRGLGPRLQHVDIGFRDRLRGTASVRWFGFVVEAVRLVRALRTNSERLRRCSAEVASLQ